MPGFGNKQVEEWMCLGLLTSDSAIHIYERKTEMTMLPKGKRLSLGCSLAPQGIFRSSSLWFSAFFFFGFASLLLMMCQKLTTRLLRFLAYDFI